MGITGTGNALGTAIWNAIKALSWVIPGDLDGTEDGRLEELWQTIAAEILAHIVANADVPVQPGTFKTVDVETGDEPVVGVGDGSVT